MTSSAGRLVAVLVTGLGHGHELLNERLDGFRLLHGRYDALVCDQRARHVSSHGDSVARRSTELVSGYTVSHLDFRPFVSRRSCPS